MPDVGYFNSDSMTTFSINRPFALAILIGWLWPTPALRGKAFPAIRMTASDKSCRSDFGCGKSWLDFCFASYSCRSRGRLSTGGS